MAHYFTDEELNLFKVAGNFNPNYKCSQLVVEKTFGSGSSFEIDGLDLEGDGGTYDIVFSFPTATNTGNPTFRLNRVGETGTGNSYVYGSYVSQNGVMSMTGQVADTSALLGVYSTTIPATTIMTLTLSNNVPMWKLDYITYYKSVLCSTVYGYTGSGNVTSLQIYCPHTIPAGLNIKIYKRIVNVTALSPKGNVSNIKELWINPSPNSDYAGGTINLSSDDYDYIVILSYNSAVNPASYLTTTIAKDNLILGGSFKLAGIGRLSKTTWQICTLERTVTVNSYTSLTFSDATAISQGSYSGTTYNGIFIPQKILGVKVL